MGHQSPLPTECEFSLADPGDNIDSNVQQSFIALVSNFTISNTTLPGFNGILSSNNAVKAISSFATFIKLNKNKDVPETVNAAEGSSDSNSDYKTRSKDKKSITPFKQNVDAEYPLPKKV